MKKDNYKKTYSAWVNSILRDCNNISKSLITPLKLQKLLYLSFGKYLNYGYKEDILTFQAWHMGL